MRLHLNNTTGFYILYSLKTRTLLLLTILSHTGFHIKKFIFKSWCEQDNSIAHSHAGGIYPHCSAQGRVGPPPPPHADMWWKLQYNITRYIGLCIKISLGERGGGRAQGVTFFIFLVHLTFANTTWHARSSTARDNYLAQFARIISVERGQRGEGGGVSCFSRRVLPFHLSALFLFLCTHVKTLPLCRISKKPRVTVLHPLPPPTPPHPNRFFRLYVGKNDVASLAYLKGTQD